MAGERGHPFEPFRLRHYAVPAVSKNYPVAFLEGGFCGLWRCRLFFNFLPGRDRERGHTLADIDNWRRIGLLSRDDVEALDTRPAAHRKTLAQAIDEYESIWEIGAAEAGIRRGRLRVIAEILGRDSPVAELDYNAGEKLQRSLKERGLKVATIRKYLQDAKRCLRHQVVKGVLPHNPFTELSAGRMPLAQRPTQVRLSSHQVKEVVRRAKQRVETETGWTVLGGWLDVFLLLLFGTGLRRKEAMSARWEHIDWKDRSLLVPAENAKNGQARRVGLGQRLFSELEARRQPEGIIFPHYSPTRVTKAVTEHFALCGLKMRLHDARHTYATLLQEEAGARPDQAMQRTGHGDMAMLSHYTHSEFGEVLEDRLGFMGENTDSS
jgi:integrase